MPIFSPKTVIRALGLFERLVVAVERIADQNEVSNVVNLDKYRKGHRQ